MALVSTRRSFVHRAALSCRRVVFLIILGLSGYERLAAGDEALSRGEAAAKKAAEAESKLRAIVYLEAPDDEGTDWPSNSGILSRELFRQALLMAGRQSLGLTTRDGCLRELLPEGTSHEHAVHFTASSDKDEALHLAVVRGQGDRRKVLWRNERAVIPGTPVDYVQLATQAEELSRTGFVTALKTAGFDGKAVTGQPDVVVPPAIDKLLGEMTFVSQFRAVRALHGTIQSQGESPWLVGALVRAYAHLGILTECHWSSSHKVYKARALLYAQRLVKADPQSPWGLWHRAYGAALAGLHQAALNDLAQAARLRDTITQKSAPIRPTDRPPEWVGLVEAVCRFDAASLQESAKHAQHGRLAQVLRYRVLESKSAVHLTLQAAQQALRDNPQCFRIYDSLASTGGVSMLHTTTLAGMAVFTKAFPQQLKPISDLPAAAVKALDQQVPEPQLLDALVVAGGSRQDRGEPSWTMLGRRAQDTRFLQFCLRLWFMRHQWGVSIDDVLPVAKAIVAGHPCAKFVEAIGLDPQRQKTKILRLLADVPFGELDYRAEPVFRTLYDVVDAERWKQSSIRAHKNLDDCHDDSALILSWRTGPARLEPARLLLGFSPYSPLARAVLIAEDWASVRDKAEQWEKESQRPEVLVALGRRYADLKKLDDAERCVKHAVELSPEIDTYRLLADLYKGRGQTDQWVATLEKVLQQPDTGLDHAGVQVEIARHFMAQKDFRRAQPYADAAAESWASWAMLCASECHERLGNWAQSELWVRRVSERYPESSAYMWPFWCKRTGKGDVQAAQQLLADHLQQLGAPPNNDDHLCQAALWAFAGEPGKAADALKPVVASRQSPFCDFLTVLFLDEAGETRRRDQALKTLNPKNPYKPLADFFIASLAKGEAAAVDLVAAEKILKAMPWRERLHSYYFLGRFLELRGQQKAARDYYQRQLAEEGFSNQVTTALAGSRLHAEGK